MAYEDQFDEYGRRKMMGGGFTGFNPDYPPQPPPPPNLPPVYTGPGSDVLIPGTGPVIPAGTDLGNGRTQPGIPGQTQQNNNQSRNYGDAPPGFDRDKWNDPALGTSNKYIAGRMAAELLAQGMKPRDIVAAVAQRLGARQISDDTIEFPDGFRADLFYDIGGPQQRVQYTDVSGSNYRGGGSNTPPGSNVVNQNGMTGYSGGTQSPYRTQTREEQGNPPPVNPPANPTNPFTGWNGSTGIRPLPVNGVQNNPFQTNIPQTNRTPLNMGLQNDQQQRMRNMGFSGFRVT